MRRRLAWWVASGAGAGCSPWAPGTVGSGVGLLAGLALLGAGGPAALWAGAGAAAAAGLWAIPRAGLARDADPGWVVIDEVAGQLVALGGLARASLPGAVLAFALFRALDIAKPGPVGWADRRHGAPGIMGDDLIAGALVAAALLAARRVWPGLLQGGSA